MIDKSFCMSSYLAFRYIERDNMEFFYGLQHRKPVLPRRQDSIPIADADELNREMKTIFSNMDRNVGILLSGGMDSGILASYMPQGSHAYTFRFLGGKFARDELQRAEHFAAINGLDLHYVDISWKDVQETLPVLFKMKGAPVHSIEPQVFIAAKQALSDDVETLVIGDAADYVFYGMDGLLSKDWRFDDFVNRTVYVDPGEVLEEPSDILYLFERYRKGEKIDFLSFYDSVITEESYGSYQNAFIAAGMDYLDPYERFRMANPVDLERTRQGESKYIIRRLFRIRYPKEELPEKNPMPRPVDEYFKEWVGPKRKEFKKGLQMDKYTGNQKWLLWCLEYFLELEER